MPLLMPSTFAPMENGDYLLLGQDHGENLREIARHSQHDADAYEAFNHDVLRVCRAIKPLLDQVPPDIFSDDPEELVRAAPMAARGCASARPEGPPRRGPPPDRQRRRLPRRLLRVRDPQGLPRLVVDHRRRRSARISQGSGLVLLYHIMGEHDGEFGAWAFHKRRQRRLHPGARPGGPGVRRRDRASSRPSSG